MNLLDSQTAWNVLADCTWRASLEASVLIGFMFALSAVLGKRLSMQGRYWLGSLVLIRLITPGIPAVGWSPWRGNGLLWKTDAMELTKPSNAAAELSVLPKVQEGLVGAFPAPTRAEAARPLMRWRALLQVLWTLGVLTALGCAVWQHRRLAKRLRTQERATGGPLLDLLAECKALARVSQRVDLAVVTSFSVPALYGFRRPLLLLPESARTALTLEELKMVFLHELAHVKRRDILLNWVMILARALHWFNPLVWGALRRLRADRELVCDQMVLRLLSPPDRTVYGKTLLKLVERASTKGFCPSVVPMANNKLEIKRRIVMISKFKPVSTLSMLATAALLLLVSWFTFTRAAAPPKAEPELAPPTSRAAPVINQDHETQPESARNPEARQRAAVFKGLRKRLRELEARIELQQAKVDQARRELGGIADAGLNEPAAGLESVRTFESITPDTIRMLEQERASSAAAAARYEILYKELKSKAPAQLAQAIPTALPDAELAQLLRDRNTAERELARLKEGFGDGYPQVKQEAAVRAAVDKQIDARSEGILAGLAAQVEAQKASAAALANHLQDMRMQYEQQMVKASEQTMKHRPYFLAKRDLETLRKAHDALVLRLWTEFETLEGDVP